MIALFLIFWGPFILFSIVTIPVYIPVNSAQVFLFPHIFTNTYFFVFFCKSYSVWDDIALWFLFPFPLWLVMFNTFPMCLFTICMYSLVECLFSSFGSFLLKFFSIVLHEFFMYFRYYPLIKYDLQIFLWFDRLLFLFVDGIFCFLV